MEESIESLKAILANPATPPSYKQVVERKLHELQYKSARPTEPAPAPANPAQRSAKYQGVTNMTVEEIVHYYSTGQFYRLDQPISGLEALCSVYRIFGICGKERETVDRVAEAIRKMGGDLPEMQHIEISDLLKKD